MPLQGMEQLLIDTVKSAKNNCPGANIGAERQSKLTGNGD
jgi:hypothetical protein